MAQTDARNDIKVNREGHVAIVTIARPPNNFFDIDLIHTLADVFDELDADADARAVVLASEGKNFCAGNNFGAAQAPVTHPKAKALEGTFSPLYAGAVRLFSNTKPIVGAIQGAAVGGGFGLALLPDFRVVCPEARFTANFVKLGFHPGFGLTHTLPRLIGQQNAALLFQTGRRINGEQALSMGIADVLTDADALLSEAVQLAAEIAENAPLAVQSVRATLRAELADAVKKQTDHENAEQARLAKTNDHKEGVLAVAERRPGNFTAT